MSRTLNKVMLIGNVGKDPENKKTPSGIPVSSFPLATSETWKDKNGAVQEHTDWHTVVAWRGLAEVIQKLVKKGSRVYIEGRIQTRNFEDKEGKRRHITEILAENMLLLDQRQNRPQTQSEDESVAEKIDENDYETIEEPNFFDFDDSLDSFASKKADIDF